ncbi:MAG: hypothetical protein V4534_03550 [Myxococcota bacterium]
MEYIKNVSVSEFGNIKAGLLSHFLTAMLCVNAISITVAISVLDQGMIYPQNLGIALSVFSSAGAVFLFFLLKRYIETINYKFYQVDQKRLESIARIAKRFFTPFMISMLLDIIFAGLGGVTLILALWNQAA